MLAIDHIFEEVSTLKPIEKMQLVDKIFNSLEYSNKSIDELWANEAQSRIQAYDENKIQSKPMQEVFKKYQRA